MFIALRWMQRPERVMMWLTENIQACLRDFQTGTASMARKRHLASTARGFYGFCLMAQIEVQKVQKVQKVQIRPIRLIRGRKTSPCSGVLPSRQRLRGSYIPRALPPVTHGSAFQAPERLWGTCDVIALQTLECVRGTCDVTIRNKPPFT